jgi:DNA-binding MarR family transcriptional regulator
MTKLPDTLFCLATLQGRLHRWFWRGDGLPPLDRRQVLFEARHGWLHGGGLSMRSHGANATRRKQLERTWRSLEEAKLVTIRGDRGRRTHVRFTDRGQVLADCLTGSGSRHTWWAVFRDFVRAVDRTGHRLLPESYVAKAEPFRGTQDQLQAIIRLHNRLMPFIVAGHVESAPDTRGRHWLCLTDEGRAAFAAGRPKPPSEDWQHDPAVGRVYDQAFTETAAEIEAAAPQKTSHVIIPIGCGCGWGHFRKYLRTVRAA